MSEKKLLIGVEHTQGNITAVATLAVRKSVLAPNDKELNLIGEFSLFKAPGKGAIISVTPELIKDLKELVKELEREVKEPKQELPTQEFPVEDAK